MGSQLLSKQSALLTLNKYLRDERYAKTKLVLESGKELYGKEGIDVVSRMIHRHGIDYFEIHCGKELEKIRVNYFSSAV